MTPLIIIPARGGSKGIPQKNLAICAGKELIDWTWQAARNMSSGLAVISTDDPMIAQVGGPNHVLHPAISDDAQIEDRIDEVLNIVGYEHDPVVILQPTSPVRTGRQIDEAIEQLIREEADSLVSVVPTHAFTWTDMGCQGGSHPVASYDPEHRPNRQDISQFRETGSIYVFTREHWERTHCRLGGKISLYEMPPECGYEIDTPFDLWLVGQILEKQRTLTVGNVW